MRSRAFSGAYGSQDKGSHRNIFRRHHFSPPPTVVPIFRGSISTNPWNAPYSLSNAENLLRVTLPAPHNQIAFFFYCSVPIFFFSGGLSTAERAESLNRRERGRGSCLCFSARSVTPRCTGVYGDLIAFAGSNSKLRLLGFGLRQEVK